LAYGTATGSISHALANFGRWSGTTPVGSYPPNPFGLYDMAGNVFDWCSSLHRFRQYRPDDGREDMNARGNRVLRGGSWFGFAFYCGAGYRFIFRRPEHCGMDMGFRVVVSDSTRVGKEMPLGRFARA